MLFDLTANDNVNARSVRDVANESDKSNTWDRLKQTIRSEHTAFARINKLLAATGFSFTIENSYREEIITRHKSAKVPYSMAQLSDGERNAVIVAANVLTVEPGTVILIDEPERHLHRAVIEPFLSALFAERPDCSFVISTHEVALPLANPGARVLITYSCQWEGERPINWDAKLLEENADLPEDLRRVILGAQKRILFVEGQPQSLDAQLYSALFPAMSVIPVGSCDDVIKAVEGMSNSSSLHDVEAFGLIDGDNRNITDVSRLTEKSIYTLNSYSVESIYYCSDAMNAVAQRQDESLSRIADELVENAKNKALGELGKGKLAKRMAARLCERKVREELQFQMPDWKSIANNPNHTITLNTGKWYQEELYHFRQLLDDKDLEKIIARYPVRQSGALDSIATTFELNKLTYRETLLARVRADAELAEKLRQLIQPLADILTESSQVGDL